MNRFKAKLIQLRTDIERFIQYGDIPTSYYIKKGLKVGKQFDRQSGTRLDISNCWLIEIGDNVVLANRVQLLAHDDAAEQLCGYRKIGKIVIGNNVFIGAGTLVLPGVTIGNNCIIGAESVVTRDIPASSVAVGTPARVIKTTEEYIAKMKTDIDRASKDGRLLDIHYDIHCKADIDVTKLKLENGKAYYFKIKRYCDEKNR